MQLSKSPGTVLRAYAVIFAMACVLVLGGVATTHAATGVGGDPAPTAGKALPSPKAVAKTTTSSCPGTEDAQTIANPLKFCSLDEVLDAILKAAIQLGTIILTLALIYTGFKFIAARGNEEAISKAKTALMWTIIGGLILLGATAIKEVIQSTVTSVTP